MNKIYRIADINILVKMPFQYNTEDEVIKPFITEDKNFDVCYEFIEVKNKEKFKSSPIYDNSIVKVYKKDNKFLREFYLSKPNTEYACLEEINNSKYICFIYPESSWIYKKNSRLILRSMALENTFINFDALILHSSFINYNGQGILFSGPSGIGKSTQASLWEKYRNAEIINGDRAVLRKKEGVWNAYGLPYAGSSHIYLNKNYPLNSIVILKQSKENKVIQLNEIEALKYILREVTINHYNVNYYNKAIDLVEEIVKSIPVFLLECTPDEDSINIIENKIRQTRGISKNDCKTK